MKTQLRSPLALALLALLLALPGLRAASANPPDRMSYQGYLVDADGFPLGSNAPVNHTLEFRIYNVSSGGSALWGESQIVTIDKGYFSVLLGDGTPFAGTTLSALFQGADASDRYVSVKDLTLAGSTEMLPRLRLVTSPYAMMATTLPPGAITNGLFAAASITGDKLATNTLTAANFSTNVGLWTATNGNVYRSSGNVGIGTATPSAVLSVGAGSIADPFVPIQTSSSGSGTARYIGVNKNGAYGLLMGVSETVGDTHVAIRNVTTDPLHIMVANTTKAVTVLNNGNVGIGTVNPGGVLEVSAQYYAPANLRLNQPSTSWGTVAYHDAYRYITTAGGDPALTSDKQFNVGAGGVSIGYPNVPAYGSADALYVRGNVGIGTLSTAAGLQVETSGSINGQTWSYASKANINGSSFTATYGGNPSVTIYTSGDIGCRSVYFFSDARLKDITGHSQGGRDLDTLLGIEVTDYTYKDKIGLGDAPHKKVIAQQVEKVYPQAVTQAPGAVPDIYQLTAIKDGWVQLDAGLKVGERVKLMTQNASGIYEIREVRKGAFRTDFKPSTEQVFVFGREVKDFRSVDYDEISMLNVSATQELARKVKAQETELTGLRAELAKLRTEKKSLAATVTELQAQDEARESRLARLEQALAKDAKVIQAKATPRLTK